MIFFAGFNLTINSIFTKEKEALYNKASFYYVQKYQNDFENDFFKIDSLIREKNFSEALSYSFKILELIDENDYQKKYRINTYIGEINDNIDKKVVALKFFKNSLNYLNYIKNPDFKNGFDFEYELAKLNLKIGQTYQYLKKNDSAKIFYEKLNNTPSLNKEISRIIASSYTNLSGIYEVDSLYVKAEEYALKAIEIHRKNNNDLNQVAALNNLANIYLSQGNYKNARKIYFEALELIKNDNSLKSINYKANLYYNLAWAMRNLKDYKAYDNLERSFELSDTIRKVQDKKRLEEIASQYNVETVRKEVETKRLIREQKFWIILAISFIIIVSLAFYVVLYYQRKKTLALKLERADFIQKQKIDAVKTESQARVLNATIDGKETERKVIAETLHDNVSALLSSANLHLQAARKHFDGNIPLEIYKSQQIIGEASEKIRNLSHNLVSSILLKFGLSFAIKDIIQKYSNSALKINTEIESLRRYNQNFEIKTYNIVQEFLNNILKHSKASEAMVMIKEADDHLIIKISDNGIGFDKTKINLKDGLGINQIDARISIMKGEFKIDSKEGVGTKISIKLPIQEKENSISA